jgi:hypothetical protein
MLSAGSEREAPTTSKLFRYTRVAYAKSLITQGFLFFASPSDFNDPFDCQIHLSVEASRAKYKSYAAQMLKNRRAEGRVDLNRQERRALAKKMVEQNTRKLTAEP